jgi:hypothetical protein
MMIAFTALPGAGFILRVLAVRLEARQAQEAARALQPVFRFGGAAAGMGALVGLWLAASYGFWAHWLVATYTLVVLAILNSAIEDRWARRLIAASPGTVASILAEPLPRAAGWVSLALWGALLWLMISKPWG